MLEFWCLSPVRVAYHGSFRENLESAFLGSWTVDPAVLRPLEVAAVLRLGGKGWIIADVDRCQDRGFEMLQFWCLSPVRVVYHGSFRKNLGSAFWGFGVSYRSLIRQMQVFKKGTSGVLQFWCLSPVRVVYHGSFRENLESSFRGLGLSYVISQLDETHASLQNGAVDMLQFWCLSPVRVAYHGLFRGNLKSAFWGLGLSTLLCWGSWKLQVCCDWQTKGWIIADVDRCQDRGFEMLQFWCLSPVRVVYHGSFRENLESAFWGLGVSYHNLIKHMQVFKTERLKCCSFDASSHSEWLMMAHLERIWSQHFGALECHITTWLGRCGSSKRSI